MSSVLRDIYYIQWQSFSTNWSPKKESRFWCILVHTQTWCDVFAGAPSSQSKQWLKVTRHVKSKTSLVLFENWLGLSNWDLIFQGDSEFRVRKGSNQTIHVNFRYIINTRQTSLLNQTVWNDFLQFQDKINLTCFQHRILFFLNCHQYAAMIKESTTYNYISSEIQHSLTKLHLTYVVIPYVPWNMFTV